MNRTNYLLEIGESNEVNFKKELAHIPVPSGSQCFPSIEQIRSFAKDSFDSRSSLDGSKGLIKQAYNLNDMEESYFDQMTIEEQDSCHIEALGACYEEATTERKQVESRHGELLKKFKLLKDQKKDLKIKEEVIDWLGQIDINNVTEVMGAATKASLEKTKAYIKKPSQDLKNF
ncbi:hypothetical protein Cgig2_015522 [Carnegiea gigantea]|uniref:Uncharacterized protein n=1 Tax=Carnegiea gigantea TaxID=171969 RepID=A0A9Q1GLT1_9CARY|nr:hypothetical protein Cgig2_015522 [Carnegiea gigantea]